MSFSNPITGGQGALIRPAIKSPNFIHNVSGWTINRDGSAEFNNLTVRGTFFGTTYILNSNGAFFYNGTPAAGNLVLSIASAAGTDGFGNAYVRGLGTYAAAVNTYQLDSSTGNVQMGAAAGAHWLYDVVNSQAFMYDINALMTARQSASVGNSNFLWLSNLAKQFFLINGGTVSIGALTTAGALPTASDSANAAFLRLALGTTNDLQIQGQANTAAPGNIVPLLVLHGGSTGNTAPGNVNNPQLQILPSTVSGAIDIALYGGAVYRSDLGGWQVATPGTGWSTAAIGSRTPLQFRIGIEDNLEIFGAIEITSVTPNATAFTLAAGPPSYRIPRQTDIAVIQLNSGGAWKANGVFLINVSGPVQILLPSFAALAIGDIFVFNTPLIPLGNLP